MSLSEPLLGYAMTVGSGGQDNHQSGAVDNAAAADAEAFPVVPNLRLLLRPLEPLRCACDALLCVCPTKLADALEGSCAHTLVQEYPELLVGFSNKTKSRYTMSGELVSVETNGSLPAANVIFVAGTAREYGRPQEVSQGPHGLRPGEAPLMKMALQAFSLSHRQGWKRLALVMESPTTDQQHAVNARVLANALLLFCREGDSPLQEVAILIRTEAARAAYREAFTRFTAASERQHFFLASDPATLTGACPQPVRQAPVKRLAGFTIGQGKEKKETEKLKQSVRKDLTIGQKAVGFQIEQLLTSEECRGLVESAERAGLEAVSWEYDPRYRDCHRVVCRDEVFASELWRRLQPLLHRDDLHEIRPIGWGTEGVWAPCGMNECLRISRYDTGGHFAMHRDGPFVLNDDTRSIFTVLCYLNEDFKGGATVFEKTDADGSSRMGEMEVVEPRTGSALVFTHDARHEGRQVFEGSKYVLRTDLMFSRVDSTNISQQCNIEGDPGYQRCEALYRESILLQNEGDAKGSTAKYLEALELQAQLASIRRGFEDFNGILPDACFAAAIDYLSAREAVDCAAVSRRAQRVALDSRSWLTRYARRWSPQPCGANPHAPWYNIYKYRLSAEECWKAAIFEIGFRQTRYAMLGTQPAKNPCNLDYSGVRSPYWYGSQTSLRIPRESAPCTSDNSAEDTPFLPLGATNQHSTELPLGIGELPSVISQVAGHYWGARSGFKNYAVGYDAISDHRWDSSDTMRGAFKSGQAEGQLRPPDLEVLIELVRWGFAFGFEQPCEAPRHPLLIMLPPHLSAIERTKLTDHLGQLCSAGIAVNTQDWRYEPRRTLMFMVPYLLIESQAVLALKGGSQEDDGLCVHLAELCSVNVVRKSAVGMSPLVFPPPTGLCIDEEHCEATWREARGRYYRDEVTAQRRHGPSPSAAIMAERELMEAVTKAAAEALAAAGKTGSLWPTVVTSDGTWPRWLVHKVADCLKKVVGLSVLDVNPYRAAVLGGAALVSAPEGRCLFRSAEGARPPAASTEPALHRW